jgi:hypothetical protein
MAIPFVCRTHIKPNPQPRAAVPGTHLERSFTWCALVVKANASTNRFLLSLYHIESSVL